MIETKKHSRCGFTLVELATVLVILGLLVGGIVAGDTLYQQSKLKTVLSDLNKFDAGIAQFRSQYNGLPGDLTNATTIWGTDTANACQDLNNASPTFGRSVQNTPTLLTCNGNGNGLISNAGTGTDTAEIFRSWQQLVNAGVIDGNFTGVPGGNDLYEALRDMNAPSSKYSEITSFTLQQIFDNANNYYYNCTGVTGACTRKNVIFFGQQGAALNGFIAPFRSNGPVLKAEEMFYLDTKGDDGLPGMGAVQTLQNSLTPNCTEDANNYAVTQQGRNCTLLFFVDYETNRW